MIKILSSIAKKLYWIKLPTIVVGAGLVCLFAFAIVNSPAYDSYVVPSFIAVLWCLLLNVLVTAFTNPPPIPDSSEKFFRRIMLRVRRLAHYLLGIAFIVLLLFTLSSSYKLFGVWRAAYAA